MSVEYYLIGALAYIGVMTTATYFVYKNPGWEYLLGIALLAVIWPIGVVMALGGLVGAMLPNKHRETIPPPKTGYDWPSRIPPPPPPPMP